MFEDLEWKGFFWSSLPSKNEEDEQEAVPLAQSLLNAICVNDYKELVDALTLSLNFAGSAVLS